MKKLRWGKPGARPKKGRQLISALAALILAVALFPMSPSVFAEGNDVGSQIDLTNLTVQLGNATVYQHTPPNESPADVSRDNIVIKDGDLLSFNLNWAVADPDNSNFQDGDYFTIPVMQTKGFTSFSTGSYPLVVEKVIVATGRFEVTRQEDGSSLLSFKVTFNANADSKTIAGGYANGDANVTLSQNKDGAYIDFEYDNIYEYFPKYVPPKQEENTVKPPVPGTGESPWWMVEKFTPVEPPVDLNKRIISTPADSGNIVGNSKQYWPALPARDAVGNIAQEGTANESFPSFQWEADFWGMQNYYESNPAAGPSGYVILKDTISANQEFSNYLPPNPGSDNTAMYNLGVFYGDAANGASGSQYGGGGVAGPSMPVGKDSIKNDFFSVPILTKAFDNLSISGLDSKNAIYVPQSQFTQICNSAGDPTFDIYSSPAKTTEQINLEYSKHYADAEAAVTGTPMSWTLVRNAGGTKTLLVNTGRFGQHVPGGQGVKPADLFYPGQGVRDGMTMYIYSQFLRPFLITQGTIAGVVSGEDTPFTHIVSKIPLIDNDLAGFAPGSAKAGLFNHETTLNANGKTYTFGWPDEQAYKEAYNAAMTDWAKMKTDAKAYMQDGNQNVTYANWPAANRIINNVSASCTYQNLRYFIWHLNGAADKNGSGPGYDKLPYGTADEADRYVAIVYNYNLFDSFDRDGLQGYAGSMNSLAQNLENWRAHRDGAIKALLFHIPQMRTILALQMGLDVAKLDKNGDGQLSPDEFSDAGLIAAIVDGDSLARYRELQKTPAAAAYANGEFTGAKQHAYGFNYLWADVSGINAYLRDHPIDDFAVSSLGLMYRTILTDTSNSAIINHLDVIAGAGGPEASQTIQYRYRYAAGIFALDKGGAIFVKADAAANDKTGAAWESKGSLSDPAALDAIAKKLGGAAFSVYNSKEDAEQGVDPVTFKAGPDANSYLYNTGGSVTKLKTSSGGVFLLTGFPEAGAAYWIKETAPPDRYDAFSDPQKFTVTADQSAPNYYIQYDKALPQEETTTAVATTETTETAATTVKAETAATTVVATSTTQPGASTEAMQAGTSTGLKTRGAVQIAGGPILSGSVQTGDSSNFIVYVLIAALAALAAALILLLPAVRKRRGN